MTTSISWRPTRCRRWICGPLLSIARNLFASPWEGPGTGPIPRCYNGRREPGFIPVLQLNYVFGRNVPCATCPFTRMKSVGDKMLDAPPFQQQGIELDLENAARVGPSRAYRSFGSARAIAAAYNREPALFRTSWLAFTVRGISPPHPTVY